MAALAQGGLQAISSSCSPGRRSTPELRKLSLLDCRPLRGAGGAGAVPAAPHRRCAAAAGMVPPVLRDGAAAAAVGAAAYSLVRAFDVLAERRIIQKSLSRKMVHIMSGLLYMASWPMFSWSEGARFFAATVPLLNVARLAVYGLGILNDDALVASVSRQGKPDELLRGPLYYVVVLLVCVLFFWRDSPVGVVSISLMCGGDGFADIVGRNYGVTKLPFNKSKSWAGSIAMLLSGFLLSIGMLYYFSWLGFMDLDWGPTVWKVMAVALISTLVESLPSALLDDNVSVPLASMLVGLLLFGAGSHSAQ